MDPDESDLAGRGKISVKAGVFLAQGTDPKHRDFKYRIQIENIKPSQWYLKLRKKWC
jgi:hypothetical protein